MILTLNKKNSLRSDSFLFLTLQHHNFLTLFIRGGWKISKTKESGMIKLILYFKETNKQNLSLIFWIHHIQLLICRLAFQTASFFVVAS